MGFTPDDWTAIDSAGGPPTVCLPVVRGVDVDLAFQQDLDSPHTIDPLDDDGFYTPAPVSMRARMCPYRTANSTFLEFSG